MAITKSQQARQMLKKGTSKPVVQGGVDNYLGKQPQVVAPRKWQSSPDAPPTELAYITKAEKDLILKKDIHGSLKKGPNVGPSGIMSLDSFGDADGSGMAGGDVSRAESGDFGPIGGGGGPELPPGVTRKTKPTKTEQELRSAFIAAGGGQRVNPGFFDSRNTVSPTELAAAKAFAPSAFAKSRRGSFLDFISGGGITGALIRGLGQRFGFGKKFNQPTYDMSKLSNLPFGGSASFENLDIRDKFNRTPDDEDDDTIPITIDDDMSLIPRKNLNDYEGVTPFQKDVIEGTQDQDFTNFENAMFASAKPLDYRIGLSNKTTKSILDSGFNIDGTEMTPEEKIEYERQKKEMEQTSGIPTQFAADGGMIGGGIMDAAGRQGYFFGKLVKKAKRAVKKIVKSPIGKIGLGALALKFGGGFGAKSPLMNFLFKKGTIGSGLTGKGMLALGGALSAAPLLIGQEEEQQPTGFTGSVGGNIDPRAYTDPYSVLFPAFRAEGSPKEGEKGIMKVASAPDVMDSLNDLAQMLFGKNLDQLTDEEYDALQDAARDSRAEGGSMKEPVAKKTMPLLDMGGQEMDLRAEGGFVPIGRMEKADDVPARLSKNEFVFTADAVRNAGDGDVDKGAEVMYNMMKNLEAGGDVSEESQGLEGARNMFQTSKRLEEVI